MENKKCNILVNGILSTGSSALIDVLREYDNIHLIPGEFDDFRAPGRIADQLVFTKTENFNKIKILTDNKSRYSFIFSSAIRIIKKILKVEISSGYKLITTYQIRYKQLMLLKKLNEKLTSEISFEEKMDLISIWINEIGHIKNKNKDFVLFNQPLVPSIEPKIWKQVFSPFKLIIVYRDPKDQLAEIIRKGNLYVPYGAPNMNHGGLVLESIYGRSRQSAIKFHLQAVKKRMEWIDRLKTELSGDEFLLIDFEGLINNYELYRKIIENFIGDLNPNPDKFMKYFNPSNAAKNIGIQKLILKDEDIQELKSLEDWYIRNINSNPLQLETPGI